MPIDPIFEKEILRARDLIKCGATQDALYILDDLRKKNPGLAITYIEMADVFEQKNIFVAAQTVLENGLIACMKNPSAQKDINHALAQLFYRHNHLKEALALTTSLIASPLSDTAIELTHASLLRQSGDHENASLLARKILSRDTNNIYALSLCAGIAKDKGDDEIAIELLEKAHKIAPFNVHIGVELSFLYFMNDRLKDGWNTYTARFGMNADDPNAIIKKRPFNLPAWDGTPTDKTILLWGEQGVGEEILYSTMLQGMHRKNPNILVECDARLLPLFQRSFPRIEFFSRSNPPHERLLQNDLHTQSAMGNLGIFLRGDKNNFSIHAPLLKADAEKTNQLRQYYHSLKKHPDDKVIGLSWRSKAMRHGDPKSIPFERFAPLFSSGKHVFISLQHGDISDDLKMAQQKNWPLYEDTTINQQTSIDDFAAQICATDEVISVSNSTAHLAGALGIQGHVLLAARKGLMWHWFKSDAQSLWYPSLILLRQKTDGDWSDVLANLFKKFC